MPVYMAGDRACFSSKYSFLDAEQQNRDTSIRYTNVLMGVIWDAIIVPMETVPKIREFITDGIPNPDTIHGIQNIITNILPFLNIPATIQEERGELRLRASNLLGACYFRYARILKTLFEKSGSISPIDAMSAVLEATEGTIVDALACKAYSILRLGQPLPQLPYDQKPSVWIVKGALIVVADSMEEAQKIVEEALQDPKFTEEDKALIRRQRNPNTIQLVSKAAIHKARLDGAVAGNELRENVYAKTKAEERAQKLPSSQVGDI
jgi:hypothetical protein